MGGFLLLLMLLLRYFTSCVQSSEHLPLHRVAMLGVVGVLTVEAQGKGPWWEIPGKVSLHPRRLYDSQ